MFLDLQLYGIEQNLLGRVKSSLYKFKVGIIRQHSQLVQVLFIFQIPKKSR